MADLDYNELAAIAEELIEDSGREITIIRFDQTPSDSNKPWNGPSNPRTSPDATATLTGCFVPLSDGSSLGLKGLDEDLMKRTDEVCLVAPGVADPPFDLLTANEILDGGEYRKVSFVKTLKPGNVVLLYFIGVER